jgi:ribosomal-protein-alanine N-acetyltransferase
VSEAWRVERASPADLSRIHGIAAQSFDAPWSEAAFAEEFRSAESVLWVARDAAHEVRGYLVGRRMLDEVHVLSLGVETSWRRRGAATALLVTALEAERKAGARLVALEVRAGNAPALAFYARHGFRAVGRRRRYYPDGEDAILLGTALETPRAAGGRR